MKKTSIRTALGIAVGMFVFALFVAIQSASPFAHAQREGGRLITLYDRGETTSFMTTEETLGAALEVAGIAVDEHDAVEPALDEKLVAPDYQVNVYRARPITVVEGSFRKKVLTPYQSAERIVQDVNISLFPEDVTTVTRSDDVISNGSGLQLEITRAVPFEFTLYGDVSTARTQADTVGEMLKDKGVKLGKDDRVSVAESTPITEGMQVRVWREGKQTITVDEAVDFEVEKIQDADRPAGFREVKTAGEKGERTVTYEVVIQDGKEVSRTEITSVTKREAKKQVEVIGVKFKYTGGPLNEEQINALGMCESRMNPRTNTGNGFHGAFQFMHSTWRAVAPSPYNQDFAYNAPLDVQKQAVQNLLSRSSIFTQFPGCANKMRAQGII